MENNIGFWNLTNSSKYKCYGEPIEIKIKEIKYENS